MDFAISGSLGVYHPRYMPRMAKMAKDKTRVNINHKQLQHLQETHMCVRLTYKSVSIKDMSTIVGKSLTYNTILYTL